MADPVTLDTGMTYDRASIEEWLEHGHNTCPSTNRTLLSPQLIPNLTLHRAIRAWCAANRSSSNVDTVSKLLEVISQCNEVGAFYDCIKEIYTMAEESGRTRRTLRDLGAIGIVTRAVVRLDEIITEKRSRSWNKGLEYAVATIAMLHPSGEADKCCLRVPGLVTILSSLLSTGSTTAKINSTKVLLSVLPSSDPQFQLQVCTHWGALKGLLSLLRDSSLTPAETRLGLRCLLALLVPPKQAHSQSHSQSQTQQQQGQYNRIAAINERAVHSLIELLPRGDPRSVEIAFAILEVLASCAEGREAITNHPFAIPRIVEYMHGVSGPATEYAVGTLHCVIEFGSSRSVVDTALKAGAFTTLLMLLPSECSVRCKAKAREMLKRLNQEYAGRPGDDDFNVFIERGINNRQQQQQQMV